MSADCGGGEPYALRVIGQSMWPEFDEGDIVIVERDGALRDGCFVIAQVDGEYTLRQLVLEAEGWCLSAINPAFSERRTIGLEAVHGVVIQKSVPGRRRLTKRYV
ncbi:MAG: S24 family peptidase [Burkholderiaceae bacterium]|nr:S24 family peptidase [Burkholderiaceae bacterium]